MDDKPDQPFLLHSTPVTDPRASKMETETASTDDESIGSDVRLRQSMGSSDEVAGTESPTVPTCIQQTLDRLSESGKLAVAAAESALVNFEHIARNEDATTSKATSPLHTLPSPVAPVKGDQSEGENHGSPEILSSQVSPVRWHVEPIVTIFSKTSPSSGSSSGPPFGARYSAPSRENPGIIEDAPIADQPEEGYRYRRQRGERLTSLSMSNLAEETEAQQNERQNEARNSFQGCPFEPRDHTERVQPGILEDMPISGQQEEGRRYRRQRGVRLGSAAIPQNLRVIEEQDESAVTLNASTRQGDRRSISHNAALNARKRKGMENKERKVAGVCCIILAFAALIIGIHLLTSPTDINVKPTAENVQTPTIVGAVFISASVFILLYGILLLFAC